MIPQSLMIKINDLLYEGTEDEPIEIDYETLEWIPVQLEMAVNCFKGNQKRLARLERLREETKIDHVRTKGLIHAEMKELKSSIASLMDFVYKEKWNTTGLIPKELELAAVSVMKEEVNV